MYDPINYKPYQDKIRALELGQSIEVPAAFYNPHIQAECNHAPKHQFKRFKRKRINNDWFLITRIELKCKTSSSLRDEYNSLIRKQSQLNRIEDTLNEILNLLKNKE